MNNRKIGQKIKERRTELGLNQEDIAKKIGVATSTVQRYEAGTIEKPKLPVLEAIARAISVAPDWLIGKSDEMLDVNILDNLPDNIIPLPKMKKIPLVGEIACGVPILADENIEEYLSCPDGIHADFCLKCKGDSMIEARIHDGDIVYIRQQPDVENGEIAAVLIDDEATLKKVYKTSNLLTLRAANPMYEDIVLDASQQKDIHILGKAIAFFSSLEITHIEKKSPIETTPLKFVAFDGDNRVIEVPKDSLEKAFAMIDAEKEKNQAKKNSSTLPEKQLTNEEIDQLEAFLKKNRERNKNNQ